MTEALGYRRFAAHGSDLGAGVTARLARAHPEAVAAIHSATPFPRSPRELAERYFTITAWREHDRGGHFPAAAEPTLLAERLRDTLRPFRQPS
jgi:pimeloyl-ACP methyl ester carboxylesterase